MKLLLFLIAFVCFDVIVVGNDKLVFEDTAVFRIEKHVFFVSDLNQRIKSLNTFNCLFKKSLLKNSIKLKSRYSYFNNNYIRLKKRKGDIKSFLLLENIISISEAKSINLTKSFYQIFKLNCLNNKKWEDWPKTIRQLVRAELYMRDRFLNDKSGLKPFLNGINSGLNKKLLL